MKVKSNPLWVWKLGCFKYQEFLNTISYVLYAIRDVWDKALTTENIWTSNYPYMCPLLSIKVVKPTLHKVIVIDPLNREALKL